MSHAVITISSTETNIFSAIPVLLQSVKRRVEELSCLTRKKVLSPNMKWFNSVLRVVATGSPVKVASEVSVGRLESWKACKVYLTRRCKQQQQQQQHYTTHLVLVTLEDK